MAILDVVAGFSALGVSLRIPALYEVFLSKSCSQKEWVAVPKTKGHFGALIAIVSTCVFPVCTGAYDIVPLD